MASRHPCPHIQRSSSGGSSSSNTAPPAISKVLTALAVSAGVAAISAGISRYILPPKPPVPFKQRHEIIFGQVDGKDHGVNIMKGKDRKVKEDFFFWMRDDQRKDRKVLKHLKKENEYTRRVMHPLKGFVEELYREMKGHLKETDMGVPFPYGGWYYYRRTEEGKSYPILCRKKELEGKEIILIDENRMAKGKKYFKIGSTVMSPDHKMMGYSTDEVGDEKYTMKFRKLQDDGGFEELDEVIENTTGPAVWGKDNKEIYYVTMDEAHRSNKVWRHVMGTSTEKDVCLYTENDPVFSAFLSDSLSHRFVYLGSGSSESSEVHFIDLQTSVAEGESPEVQLVAERQPKLLYDVEDCQGDFYITTNADGATNFKIMKTSVDKAARKHWVDFLKYDSKTKISSLTCFLNDDDKPYGVVTGRQDGLTQLWFIPDMDVRKKYRVEFGTDAYDVGIGTNAELKTEKVRYGFTSLTTPPQVLEYNIRTRESKLLKETPVLHFDQELYASKRIEATSVDGTKVPMSMVWKKSLETSEPRPCHLYGYGSYELSMEPGFRSTILPFLDRGIVYVIAHIRGGGEFGRSWYEEAKYETKQNTFHDFVACAKHLINTGVTSPDKLSIEGRSAGGLLMGSVLNMAPELFKAALAGVPFVDVMNTMSDPSIPLTTGEWLEWGNPHTEKFFKVINEYCPYSNVGAKKYPAMLVTGGLHDPRVAYWEPAKWVAKLREHTTGDPNKILLKIDMDTGHFSASDRYHYLRERAFELAFVFDQLGVPQNIVGEEVTEQASE